MKRIEEYTKQLHTSVSNYWMQKSSLWITQLCGKSGMGKTFLAQSYLEAYGGNTFLSEIWMRHLPHRYSGPGASCGGSSSQKSEKQKIAQSSFSMTWTIEMIRKIF